MADERRCGIVYMTRKRTTPTERRAQGRGRYKSTGQLGRRIGEARRYTPADGPEMSEVSSLSQVRRVFGRSKGVVVVRLSSVDQLVSFVELWLDSNPDICPICVPSCPCSSYSSCCLSLRLSTSTWMRTNKSALWRSSRWTPSSKVRSPPHLARSPCCTVADSPPPPHICLSGHYTALEWSEQSEDFKSNNDVGVQVTVTVSPTTAHHPDELDQSIRLALTQ